MKKVIRILVVTLLLAVWARSLLWRKVPYRYLFVTQTLAL